MHHLLAAFEAGVIMVFLTNPLWLIKTRMQLQPLKAQATQPQAAQERYRGLWHAVRTIVNEEGPLGLYKGARDRVWAAVVVARIPLSQCKRLRGRSCH